MIKQIDMFDTQAEIESIAIGNSYKPHTMDFGCRKKKNHIGGLIVRKESRKISRHRNSRQVDLQKQRQKQVELVIKQELSKLKQPKIVIQL